MRNRFTKHFSLVLVVSGLAFAQEQPPLPPVEGRQPGQDQTGPPPQAPAGGWRKFGDAQNTAPAQQQQQPAMNQAPNQPPNLSPNQAPNQNGYQGGYSATMPPAYQGLALPSTLTLPAGTWLTVRTTNPVSTDHNQVGDAFSAILTEPLVVNGVVVARRGQTIQGRVSTVEKAGRVSGTSKLGLELTQLSLVDGQQITLRSQMVMRSGGTSFGRDAAAIGTTTAVGAAIGAGVNGGVGAGVGAAGGLVASTIGVLLTRGKPAVIYPETVLTFTVVDPITISTVNSAGAFHPVGQQDYENNTRRLVSSPAPRPGYYGGAPYPYPYYAAPYYGGFYGPSVFFYGRGYRRW